MIPQALCFNDVLLVPKHWEGGSRSEVDLSTEVAGLKLKIPLVSANMASVTEEKMAICIGKAGGLGILHRLCSIEREAEMVCQVKLEGVLVGASIGIDDNALERAKVLIDAGADLICLDVAFFAQHKAHDVATQFRKKFDYFPLVVGNIATWLHVRKFKNFLGAEGISDANVSYKVGIGSGALCKTRTETGAGIPTFQSILDIRGSVAEQNIVADGGHKSAGDCVKSLAAGADSVMLGSMLAGTSESPGELVNGEKIHYGNASAHAKSTFSQRTDHVEGICVKVPYKGRTQDIINSILESIRSGCSYCGAKSLWELRNNAEFVQISSEGYRESTAFGQHS